MNVLSLFDGMSCGQIALERAGIHYDNYFASEIDKYAIQITQKNYPNTIQLGDVNNWKSWDLPPIDIILGGSPCQGFSIAGDGLNFSDPRSRLFFKFVSILQYYSPEYFLFENVRMKKEWRDVISNHLGVEPIQINSALVSAQNRVRNYWTDIPDITQPENKRIFLKDIIEDGEVDREKSYYIDANYFKGSNLNNYYEKSRRQIVIQGAAIRNQVTKKGVEEQLNIRKDQKSNCVVPTYSNKLNGLVKVGHATNIKGHDYNKRIYSINGKSPSLAAKSGGNLEPKIALDEIRWRNLTPLECERLQTVPDNYTKGVSSTQKYKMLGNGWTVDVIAHIFRFIP